MKVTGVQYDNSDTYYSFDHIMIDCPFLDVLHFNAIELHVVLMILKVTVKVTA